LPSHSAIDHCWIGGGNTLIGVPDLGEQALAGVFRESHDAAITAGPLRLAWCSNSGLLQLAHSYELGELYSDYYGYRSGLNRSMVDHLTQKIHELERFAGLASADSVLDIGSNDAISLKAYQTPFKFGAFTPGSESSIISKAEARAMEPDRFLVLPWDFREVTVRREAEFLARGGCMIFPFPEIESV
jgi:hypothetical protein